MGKLLRLQNNTPPYYIENSRDFQLFCRVFDSVVNGFRFDIQTMTNVINVNQLSDRMLSLYASSVGFFTEKDIDAKVLRYILSAFPYIIKNKGTQLGIEQAVYTVLKAENSVDMPFVEIINEGIDPENSYIINIYVPIKIYNDVALEELLKYVMPTGYKYNLIVYVPSNGFRYTQLNNLDDVSVIHIPTHLSSAIRGSNAIGSGYYGDNVPQYILNWIQRENNMPTDSGNRIINAFDTTEVVGSTMYNPNEKIITEYSIEETPKTVGGDNNEWE